MEPEYRPSLINNARRESSVLPFAGSDLVLSPAQWSSHVVGITLSHVVTLLLLYIKRNVFLRILSMVLISGSYQGRLARGLTWIQKMMLFVRILKSL